ncbi:amino acid ABC transporter permease [Microbispora hainanensis]|jgi:glutamate transport system permease protein|uniref:Amino acid ABC transporter permease n=1 Tax=Microbispora hainanensis TaxID=568844 RepID=A0ABZ1SQT8_9ACTN|nr:MULTISPECIES: amino acid ABC transporter permease [Microbispora]NJP28158.1 amino acid ABC transporter permease [Microbispora sp. CL1-1]TQS09340.1 amino acid ABC transporter permease [Microbispora sp. SCL1-1]
MSGRGATVLYDVPGPRARLRNNVLTLVFGVVLLLVAYFVWTKFDEKGQWDGKLWEPFLRGETWTELILPGLLNTLVAAALAAVLALLFGAVFGIARLSDHRWVRIPAGVVVEAFRAVPVLMLIFFAQYGGSLAGLVVTEFAAVVFGLTVYNGSVLAEIVRAGILAVPRGQAEAGSAIGLRKNQVMRLILLPQAVTAMMPAIVSQLVVLLKDTALGFVVAYADLLNAGARVVPANYANLIPSVIVIATVYIMINLALGYLANWLERRSRRSRKVAADPAAAEAAAGGEVALMR